MSINILAVSGSMREQSHSAHLCRIVLEECQFFGAQTRLLDLAELDLPMFRSHVPLPDHAGLNHAMESVQWADALFLVSPDYHGSLSGALKNFLDYHWSAHAGKLFGYGCISHEKGLTVMDQMRTAIRQCYGWSMPYGISINGKEDFDEEGNFTNPVLSQRARMLARDLTHYGALLRKQFQQDLKSDSPNTFAAKYRK
jgi:FMN reductase